MSATIIDLPEGGCILKLACDECGALAPPPDEILRGHGLNRMGWRCSGGKHLCPAHSGDVAVGDVKSFTQHRARREHDEWYCYLCNKRWPSNEDAPEGCA